MTPSVVLKGVAAGFIGGIFLSSTASLFDPSEWWKVFLFFLVIVCFSVLWRIFYGSADVLVTILLVTFGSLGGVYVTELHEPGEQSVATQVGRNVEMYGTVVRLDQGSKLRATIKDVTIDGESYTNRVLVSGYDLPRPRVGDTVRVRCTLEAPEPFDGFAYDQYLAARNVYAVCSMRGSFEVVKERGVHLAFFREAIVRQSAHLLGEPQATLLAGLLIGEKGFSEAWQDRFVKTGTSHIVAASGYNVTVVSFILYSFLIAVGFRRQRTLTVLLLGIALYVFLAGADPPVVRAGIMGSLVVVGRYLGRKGSLVNLLLLSAVLMLAYSPQFLLFDVGFQLSFLSTLGLMYITPYLEPRLRFVPEVFGFRESISATLAATVATVPIVVSQFGQFSWASLPVNLLILPLIPYAMAFGAAAILLSFVFTPVSFVLVAPTWFLLTATLFVIEYVAALSPVFTFSLSSTATAVLWCTWFVFLFVCAKRLSTPSSSQL